MTMTPLALSLLGVEPQSRRRQTDRTGETIIPDLSPPQPVPETRPSRSSRRATSYYHHFQTSCSASSDDPPTYASASRQKASEGGDGGVGRDILPRYDCTVSVETKVLLQLESISPLNAAAEGEWREVFMVLRGTLLSFHRPKDNGPGRLLRSYTLQHAEVGLAPDVQHTVLVPQTRLAHLLPSSARRRAWQKDPDLFKPVRQHILRIRAETDQILLADASEESIHSLIYNFCAAIDISVSIDERSIPRQCTVPRRRRRHRPHHSSDLSDPILLAEQERILRDMYPAFADRPDQHPPPDLERTQTNTSDDPPPTPARDDDEIDLAAIREDTATTVPIRPTHTYEPDMLHATPTTNFSPQTGKWSPPPTRTSAQNHRYIRRCMPLLPATAPRASDILICHGRRVRVNWRMEVLEEWELSPPSYESHHFPPSEGEGEGETGAGTERRRSCSQTSTMGAEESGEGERAGQSGGEDAITPVEEGAGMGGLGLAKVATGEKSLRGRERERMGSSPGQEIHGVVFCF